MCQCYFPFEILLNEHPDDIAGIRVAVTLHVLYPHRRMKVGAKQSQLDIFVELFWFPIFGKTAKADLRPLI